MSQNLKIEHYVLGKTLGIGAFGKVKLAKHEFSGNYVAIKIINKKRMKNNNMSAKIKREIKLLRYFNHPNIIRLYEVLETQSDVFVVMEYIPNGELFELIAQRGKIPEDEARFYFQQLISGVEYCHTNLVAHRDLKPENILIAENNTVKIGDFGLSNLMKDGKYLKTSCGSPNYAAPEVLSGKKYCGTEIDTWSCGVILFALLAGYLPFDEEVIPVLFKKIREADYQMPNHFSPEAQDLIKKLLQPDTSVRIKFHEIKLHPWVRQGNSLYLRINDSGSRLHASKLNEEIFQRIIRMGFNFTGFTEQKAREAILLRQDYSFVIAYDLMSDEYTKKQLTNKFMEKEVGPESDMSVLENIKDALGGQYIPKTEEEQNTLVNDYSLWHYGIKYQIPPTIIMAALTQTLLELDTAYIIKSANFRIKCFHQLHKSSIAQQQTIEVANGELIIDGLSQPNIKRNYKSEKYTKSEVVFLAQIFTVQPKKEYVLDIQRVKGHSIIFLQYAQKLISMLNKKLSVVEG